MYKLGDQWIEIIDGKEHMFKAVTPIVNGHTDIKDLGILKDGMLPSPFVDNKYPTVMTFAASYCWVTEISDGLVDVTGIGKNGEESYKHAKNAWNRRA